MELCLGTVQFGLDYGILGQKKPTLGDSVRCIDYATQNGVHALDTATAYGDAEYVVGSFLRKKTINRSNLFISSKMLPNVLDDFEPKDYRRVIREHLIKSLETIGTDYLDAYLLHSARYAYNDEILDALYEVQKEGLAHKVGVSVYEPDEAKSCFENSYVNFTQFPYSIFDHRMKDNGIFSLGQSSGCEMHVRSAFIQGLILLDEENVPKFLTEAKPIITKLKKISAETGISRVALAIAYVKKESEVSHLVFGVDSLEQLKEDIGYFNEEVTEDIFSEIEKEFEGIKAEIVMPSLWKR